MKNLDQYADGSDDTKDGRFLVDQDIVMEPDRDVHVILVESLINPYLLDGYSFEPSPFGDLFGKWMEDASSVITPVTGGRSPDSEFELLCGLGALLNWRETVFTALTADNVRCLPWHFSKNGWTTVATTPVSPYVFNVKSVYERLSFSKIVLRPDLKMDDLDGSSLSTGSLLGQNLALYRSLKEEGSFVFNYVFTTATHIPFALNASKRPGIIKSVPYNLVTTQYANALYYTFEALESFVSEVLTLDPNALIVVLGDHAPYLGPGFRFSDEEQTLGLANFRIPLLIIDGGVPLKNLGDIALFNLPYAIMDILTDQTYCQANRCLHKGSHLVRPLVGEAYVANRNLSDIRHCTEDNSVLRECKLAAKISGEHRSRLYELVR
jgi:phosphoglycerol transferase MdoB-like AlkP superfamily enzyme